MTAQERLESQAPTTMSQLRQAAREGDLLTLNLADPADIAEPYALATDHADPSAYEAVAAWNARLEIWGGARFGDTQEVDVDEVEFENALAYERAHAAGVLG